METWLPEWSYMKNSTCAWYFRGENTVSFIAGCCYKPAKLQVKENS